MDYFKDVPPTGAKIFWYRSGVKDEGTNPSVGFICKGWPGGIADLHLLPDQDGSVAYREHVNPLGHPGLIDPMTGRPSKLAQHRGAWEFAPTQEELIASTKKEDPVVKNKNKNKAE